MLTHLCVHNYTLVDNLDLELHTGLTTLTGETGAGKSLLLDAIGLAIGNKVRGDAIFNTQADAEVTASFDIAEHTKVRDWLIEQNLPYNDECLLKRLITPQGRSRCFINGRAVTLQQLQSLGQKLINIHGQHEHQALLNSTTQRKLLDTFGGHPELIEQTQQHFEHWKNISDALATAQNLASTQNAEYQLLKYQAEELDQLALKNNEIQSLETQQKHIANVEHIQHCGQQILSLSRDSDDNLQGQLGWITQQLQQLSKHSPRFKEIQELYNTALIHIEEATTSLDDQLSNNPGDASDLLAIEQRLSNIYTIARKHKIAPEELLNHHQQLNQQLHNLESNEEHIATLEREQIKALKHYQTSAQQLTQAREKAAQKIGKEVDNHLHNLNMKGATFLATLENKNTPSAHGDENIQFLISTIPGKKPGPLQKIASGGELSRIGLAIHVVTTANHTTPTLIFDEVDAGIGGTTGDVVGQLLRKLGSKTQVLCVTHLAQVASKAHNHLHVNKKLHKGSAQSSITALKGDAIVSEIARMIGGPVDTDTSLAHARQMMAAL
ncbi:MAG: DNA repair protein RecN [Marinagarivorans sp.]|nr:DNA repair protein RecN [Marinagarivorans sp.]